MEKQELLNQENKNWKKNNFMDTSENKLRTFHARCVCVTAFTQSGLSQKTSYLSAAF